jgi:hypothetical protein
MGIVRTVGVEEELLVVDETGVPVPKAPQALELAARRGEGEDAAEHDRVERGLADDDTPLGDRADQRQLLRAASPPAKIAQRYRELESHRLGRE